MPDTINGLPVVEGLENFLAQDKDLNLQQPQGQQEEIQAPDTTGQAQGEEDIDWGQFKNPKDLLKSYKEIQSFTTRVSQENKTLKEELDRLREDMELRNVPQPAFQQSNIPFENQFAENPQMAIQATAMQAINVQRIGEVVEEEQLKNPKEFQERIAYVTQLARDPKYAHLANSVTGVRKLFEYGDKVRSERTRQMAEQAVQVLFGNNVDLNKLRSLITKDAGDPPGATQPNITQRNLAYMPNSTSPTHPQPPQTGLDFDRIKTEAIQKGDSLSVAGALLREALSK
jgi:hypothetical protein